MAIKIKCKRCGKAFSTMPCLLKRGAKYCSEKCQNDVTPTIITCRQCGKKKRVKPYLKGQLFCSNKCRSASRRMRVPCTTCGITIEKRRSHLERYSLHFCSKKCNTSFFKKGSRPWNKGKYVRNSPSSEFKKGIIPTNKVTVGTERIRVDHRNRQARKRAWVKVSEPNVWQQRARHVWSQCYGDIPRGYVIHHKDRNSLNDTIDNLEALTKAEHINEHRHELKL